MQQRLILFVSLFAAAALLPPSSATSCPSECGRCPPLRLSQCRAGKVRDFCGCCDVCAQAFGEPCRGIKRRTCGVNLTCFPPRPPGVFDSGLCMPVAPSGTRPTTTASSSRPVSLPTNTSSGVPPTTPASRNCLQVPMCNLSYCNDNQNKICRVNRTQILGEDENADFKFKPQCLITSCKACVFVEDLVPSEQSPCVSCEVDDEECIIAYGQCVMRYMKFIEVKPLGNLPYRRGRKGRALCKVPM